MKNNKSQRLLSPIHKLRFLIIFLFFSITLTTFGATRTWTGLAIPVDSDWENADNWDGKVPSSKDNVVIPLGSPSYPIITTYIAVKSITIDDGGSLQVDGGNLDISKKMENNGTFIQNGGLVSGQDLEITSTGTLTLTDGDLTVSKSLKIDGGTFNQDGGTVTTKNIEIKNSGDYNQSTGEINISGDFKVSTGNAFNSTGGTIHFTGTAGKGADYTGNIQFYDILIDATANPKFDNDNNVNINIKGNYKNNNAGLRVTKAQFTFNGTTTQSIYSASSFGKSTFGILEIDNSASVNMLTNLEVELELIQTNGVLNLNDNILIVGGVPVPVELTSFTASKYKNGIMLNWQTATEVNNYGFDIEQASFRKDGTTPVRTEWKTIGFVEGHGNSNSPKVYSFYDKSPIKGKAIYRLKQIDTDGAFEYSNEVEISFLQSDKTELYQNHPNPFNPSTVISFNLSELSHVNITIYNAIGQKVAELINKEMNGGFHNINFDASSLSSGFYFYRLETQNYSKTMKMILLR